MSASEAAVPGRQAGAILGVALFAACGFPSSQPLRDADAVMRPTRVVSLDYCADQYVLALAEREQILALSPDATAPFSYLRERAVGLPRVRPLTEDVLILKPDLVVRAYGGGPNASAFFERAGVPVLTVGWASTVDGERLDSIPALLERAAERLGQPERGRRLVERFRARLAALEPREDAASVLYLTPTGFTTGPGSLVHEVIVAAGLDNFEREPGWRPLPLERLAYESPSLVAPAFFDTRGEHPETWSAARHPIARALLEERPVVPLRGASIACGGWFVVDAIEALADGQARAPR